jgi:hypothetical protein
MGKPLSDMSYDTRYKLNVRIAYPNENPLQEILGEPWPDFVAILEQFLKYNPLIEPCSWYSHEDDMKQISNIHSGIIFTLDGEGRESGDIWRKTFFRGKIHVAKASIEFLPPPTGFLA